MHKVDDFHTTLACHTTRGKVVEGSHRDDAVTQLVHLASTAAMGEIKKAMAGVARGRAIDVKATTIVPILKEDGDEIAVTVIACVQYVQSSIAMAGGGIELPFATPMGPQPQPAEPPR